MSPEGRPLPLWKDLLMSLSVQGPAGGGVGSVCVPYTPSTTPLLPINVAWGAGPALHVPGGESQLTPLLTLV